MNTHLPIDTASSTLRGMEKDQALKESKVFSTYMEEELLVVTEVDEEGKSGRRLKEEEVVLDDDEEDPIFDGPVTAPLVLPSPVLVPLTKAAPPLEIESIHNVLFHEVEHLSLSGIGKTIVTIPTKHFDTIEVIFDHYSTSPSSFNISFQGTIEAQKAILTHSQTLLNRLVAAFPHFTIHLHAPTFSPLTFHEKKSHKNSLVKSKRLSYSASKQIKETHEQFH